MNRRFLHLLPALAVTGLLVAGCATGPRSEDREQSGPAYDPDKPQVLLAGAKVDEAKGIAMGSAASKGWKIARSAPNTVVLERPLNAAAAGSLPPGKRPAGKPPVLEVQTDFFQRQQGVDVVLTATAVTKKGAQEEKREDYTEPYRGDLMRSLDALRTAWEENRQRIAKAMPPVAKPEVVPYDPDVPLAPDSANAGKVADAPAESAPAPAAESEAEAEAQPGTGVETGWAAASTAASPAAAPPEARAPAAASPVTKAPPAASRVATSPAAAAVTTAPEGASRVAASPSATAPVAVRPPATAAAPAAASARGAPVVSVPIGPTAAPPSAKLPPSGSVAPEPQEPLDRASNMLVLNQPSTSGGWAYYAEHYARVRGCVLTDEGAVLVEKKPEYEVHRVNCENGQTFVVRCNAGTCRGML